MTIPAGKNNGLLESVEGNWVRSAKFGLNYDTATYFFLIALHADVEPVSCDTATYSYRSCTRFELNRCRHRCSTLCTTTTRRTFSFSRFMRTLNP
jgi:hypothetical protein